MTRRVTPDELLQIKRDMLDVRALPEPGNGRFVKVPFEVGLKIVADLEDAAK